MKSFDDFADVMASKKIDDAKRKRDKVRAYARLKKRAKLKALPKKAKKSFNAKAYLKAIDSPYKL